MFSVNVSYQQFKQQRGNFHIAGPPEIIILLLHYTEIIALLYQHLGDIVQDLENIHEITTKAVQQYAKKFLKDK